MVDFTRAALLACAAPVTAPLAAQPSPPPEMRAAMALYRTHCGSEALAIVNEQVDVERITFHTPPGRPALLVLCLDAAQAAAPIEVATIETALVFMALRPFAPFWPAAEARWGADLSILRDEVKNAPIDQAVQTYPYATMIEDRIARAIVGSRVATLVGDHDRAVAVLLGEIDRIAAYQAERPRSTRYDFELSLLMGRLNTAFAKRDGPDAAAQQLEPLLTRHPVAPEYRANVMINYAATLAEAGRGAEALAIIEPLYETYAPKPDNRKVYEIPGSVREFSWILACAHHLTGNPDKAAPFMAVVNTYDEQPVDPYVTWTKGSTEIRLRMYKCMGDSAGFLDAVQKSNLPLLSPLWLEFQTSGAPVVGKRKFARLAEDPVGKALAANYRELPASYLRPLHQWRQTAGVE